MSWAALFKNTSSPSPGLVIKSCASAPLRSESAHVGAAPLMSEEPAQTTVPLEEDKLAHKLAGIVIAALKIVRCDLVYSLKCIIFIGTVSLATWKSPIHYSTIVPRVLASFPPSLTVGIIVILPYELITSLI